jgi:ethanolamine utilization protein EutL
MTPLRPKLLSVRQLEHPDSALKRMLGFSSTRHVSAGLVTCDQDDALYVALDHATKFAEVDVVYAKSFYAGSAHASGPFSGEAIGILAGPTPDDVAEGLWALRDALTRNICFYTFGEGSPAFFPHVVAESGRYLSQVAKVPAGTPLAYLIAPPMEALVGLDAALKAAPVTMTTSFGPPTETNFAGAHLTGSLADVTASAEAFVEAIRSIVQRPLAGLMRPSRERR